MYSSLSSVAVIILVLAIHHYRKGLSVRFLAIGNGLKNYASFFYYLLRGDSRAQGYMERHVKKTLWSWKKTEDPQGDIVNEQAQGI
jgi:hypothetical protein